MSFDLPYFPNRTFVAAIHWRARDIDTLDAMATASGMQWKNVAHLQHWWRHYASAKAKAKWKLNCFSVCNLMRNCFCVFHWLWLRSSWAKVSCRFSHSLFVVMFAWRRLVANQYQSVVCGARLNSLSSSALNVCRNGEWWISIKLVLIFTSSFLGMGAIEY